MTDCLHDGGVQRAARPQLVDALDVAEDDEAPEDDERPRRGGGGAVVVRVDHDLHLITHSSGTQTFKALHMPRST